MLRNINYGENDIICLTYDNKNNSFDQNIDKGYHFQVTIH